MLVLRQCRTVWRSDFPVLIQQAWHCQQSKQHTQQWFQHAPKHNTSMIQLRRRGMGFYIKYRGNLLVFPSFNNRHGKHLAITQRQPVNSLLQLLCRERWFGDFACHIETLQT